MNRKEFCGGRWTPARFHSFIKALLRSGTRKWAPISIVKKDARIARGVYLCNICKEHVPSSIVVDGKRVNNVFVDHIDPVIDPTKGFVSWDDTIDRMFCEEDGLQLVCSSCHTEKSKKEIAIAKEARSKRV